MSALTRLAVLAAGAPMAGAQEGPTLYFSAIPDDDETRLMQRFSGVAAYLERQLGVPVLTDVHEYTPMDEVASVVDVLQTPAFLVRQTDFIRKVCAAGKPVNIKKGQFLAPHDMKNVIDKARAAANRAAHGRSRAEKDKARLERLRSEQHVDGHKRED